MNLSTEPLTFQWIKFVKKSCNFIIPIHRNYTNKTINKSFAMMIKKIEHYISQILFYINIIVNAI